MRLEDYESLVPAHDRLHGGKGMSEVHDRSRPRVTVVTVCRNCVGTIEQTIRSVVAQSYLNLEYVVVDGGSTDGTLEIIRRYDGYISRWISEPDGGIYDAMNKGISLVSSDDAYILFINADDYLLDKGAVDRFITASQGEDFLYGKVILKSDEFEVAVGHALDVETLAFDMPRHQSTFVRKSLYRRLGLFNKNYRISSDFEFAVRAFLSGASMRYVEQVVAVMQMGGASAVGFQKGFAEKKDVIRAFYRGITRYKALLYIDLVELPRNQISLALDNAGLLQKWRALKQYARRTSNQHHHSNH